MSDPCELLPWDSEFFGLRIARVGSNRLTPALARDVADWLDRQSVDCAYFLADPADATTLRTAPQYGFDLVDQRVTLEVAVARTPSPPPDCVRHARTADIAPLQAIARLSHHDSRFYADGRFDSRRCDDLFALWIEKSCNGYADVALVAELDGRPAGYITGHLRDGGTGSIGLAAVDPAARGRGCGRALAAAVIDRFREHNLARATVVTQARNTAALRFYQRSGFSVANVALWYHRWSRTRGDVA